MHHEGVVIDELCHTCRTGLTSPLSGRRRPQRLKRFQKHEEEMTYYIETREQIEIEFGNPNPFAADTPGLGNSRLEDDELFSPLGTRMGVDLP